MAEYAVRGVVCGPREVSLDLGEPDLDLIEPRGIGRSVWSGRGMGAQKAERLRFMSRKVVGDDMNTGFGRLEGSPGQEIPRTQRWYGGLLS